MDRTASNGRDLVGCLVFPKNIVKQQQLWEYRGWLCCGGFCWRRRCQALLRVCCWALGARSRKQQP